MKPVCADLAVTRPVGSTISTPAIDAGVVSPSWANSAGGQDAERLSRFPPPTDKQDFAQAICPACNACVSKFKQGQCCKTGGFMSRHLTRCAGVALAATRALTLLSIR
ncbi:hypothetical protein WJX77_009969 [Trebouxia sp. C0004]